MTLFCALDIETTGLDPENDHILEIAWAITDESFKQLTPIRSHLVDHEPDVWQEIWGQLRSNDVVRNMHQESGLYTDLQARRAWPTSALVLKLRDDIEQASEGLDPEILPIHLMGLSIGFDRSFLQKDSDFGLLFDNDVLGVKFHHRLADLSAVKLILDASGVPWEKAANEKAHRAADDVLEVLDQARIFQRTLSALAVSN